MTFSWESFIFGLLTPPAICIWLALAGLVLLRGPRRWLAGSLITLGLGSLYLLSTGYVAGHVASVLERAPALPATELPARLKGWQAIVILGGGRDRAAPEWGGDDVPNYWTASRLRYGAFLYRQSGLPVLVSGGIVNGERESEATIMARSLIRDHVVNVRWQEGGSRTTWENAANSYRLLHAEGIDHIVLVTSAEHMWRSERSFEHMGFTVLPAPTDFADFLQLPLALQLVPNIKAMLYSQQALHEFMGMGWYRVKEVVG